MAYAEILNDKTISIQTQWTEKELIKQVPGVAWNSREKIWTVPLSWGSCITLRGIFLDQFNVGPKLTKWSWDKFNSHVKPLMNLRMQVDSALEKMDARLYGFQNTGSHFLIQAGDALLGDEMGTGKTIQALAALRPQGSAALPALFISPNSVKKNWATEAKVWYPEAKSYVITGSAANKRKILAQAKNDPNALVIINIESMRMFSRLSAYGSIRLVRCKGCDPAKQGDLRAGSPIPISSCEMHTRELNTFGFRSVILDEAHCIANPKAKQTRAVWAVMHGPTVTANRWAMTGTMIANSPADLWSIMHAIAPYDYPSGRTKWIDRYCLTSWNSYGGVDVVGVRPDTREEFYKILDPHFRRMPASLVLDQLPPRVRMQRYVEMSPKQAKAYTEIQQNLITRMDDGTLMITADNLHAHTRLLQFSSSYSSVEWIPAPTETNPDHIKMKVTLTDPSPKIDEFMQILEDLPNEQICAAAESRQLIDLTAKRLQEAKIEYSIITGNVNELERDYMMKEFQSGKRRVMLFTMAAGGVGLTMTAASTIVFLQRSWSMIHNIQSEKRVHRIGSERHKVVKVIDLIAAGTVEETDQIPRLYEKLYRLEEIARDRQTIAENGGDTTYLDEQESHIINSYV